MADKVLHNGTTPNVSAETTTSDSKSNINTAQLDASTLKVEYATSVRRPVPDPDSPEFKSQKVCTDHMITASWTQTDGWAAPELKPYGPFQLMPTASVLHYATECFEGLKLYRGHDGRLRLFRPTLNCRRMLRSATRIALPSFPPDELLKLIVRLCAVDGPKWLPRSRPGSFLYVRPAMIADDPAIGVAKPQQALLFILIICFPSLDFDARPQPGMKLYASRDDMVRAWPGGFGFAKLGANYGPTLAAQAEARQRGYDQVLWLLGKDGAITEAGASNFFLVLKSKHGQTNELVTAPLEDNIILDGVTRRSVIELAADRLAADRSGSKSGSEAGPASLDPLVVAERKIYMSEVVEAAREGRLIEAFAAGTAFFIAPVSMIGFRDSEIEVPMQGEGRRSGLYANAFRTWLMDIMYGREANEWSHVVIEEE